VRVSWNSSCPHDHRRVLPVEPRERPVQAAELQLVGDSGAVVEACTSDLEGRYRLVAPPGAYLLVCRAELNGEPHTDARPVVLEGRKVALDLVFQLGAR
jgi:hypothetical protein